MTADTPIPVLEIGGSHVTGALVDPRTGRIAQGTLNRTTLQSDASANELLAQVVACANRIAAPPASWWAVAIPGPFDYARGIALFTGVAKLEALYGLDMRGVLMEALQPPPAQIVFCNDAEAFLIGEWSAGSAAGHERAVGITLGTGIGSAFLDNGRNVSSGPDVPPNGHVYLLRHAGAPLEETISRRALRRRYAAAAGLDHPVPDVVEIAELARHGDPAARTVFQDGFTALGTALAPWLARFQATVVVVGGSIARSWDLVLEPLRAGLAAADVNIDVRRATHLEHAPIIGAARYVVETRAERGEQPHAHRDALR